MAQRLSQGFQLCIREGKGVNLPGAAPVAGEKRLPDLAALRLWERERECVCVCVCVDACNRYRKILISDFQLKAKTDEKHCRTRANKHRLTFSLRLNTSKTNDKEEYLMRFGNIYHTFEIQDGDVKVTIYRPRQSEPPIQERMYTYNLLPLGQVGMMIVIVFPFLSCVCICVSTWLSLSLLAPYCSSALLYISGQGSNVLVHCETSLNRCISLVKFWLWSVWLNSANVFVLLDNTQLTFPHILIHLNSTQDRRRPGVSKSLWNGRIVLCSWNVAAALLACEICATAAISWLVCLSVCRCRCMCLRAVSRVSLLVSLTLSTFDK